MKKKTFYFIIALIIGFEEERYTYTEPVSRRFISNVALVK